MQEFLQLFSVRDIVLHVINTVILFVAIRFLVYKPVRAFLDARTARVAGALDDASAKQEQAAKALSDAQTIRKTAEVDAAKAQSDGALRAQQTGEELLAAAKEQASEIIDNAHAEATQMKAAAQAEMQAQALQMAVEIAEKILGRELAVKDNEALAREFLTKVG